MHVSRLHAWKENIVDRICAFVSAWESNVKYAFARRNRQKASLRLQKSVACVEMRLSKDMTLVVEYNQCRGVGTRDQPWRSAQGRAAHCPQHLSCHCHAVLDSGQTCGSAHACTNLQSLSATKSYSGHVESGRYREPSLMTLSACQPVPTANRP